MLGYKIARIFDSPRKFFRAEGKTKKMSDVIYTLKGIKGNREKRFFSAKKIKGLRDITGLTLIQCKTIVDALLNQDLAVEVRLPPYVTPLKEGLTRYGFEVLEEPVFFFRNECPEYVTITMKMPIGIPSTVH